MVKMVSSTMEFNSNYLSQRRNEKNEIHAIFETQFGNLMDLMIKNERKRERKRQKRIVSTHTRHKQEFK